ncbi:MAG: hypothetical protein NC225_02130 [Clostridium sp.]|nr:hypothetical protein [Clostridium sp.]MCM1398261.1 hypothetical protein [Clostridium sp.]MCM1459075.1 hypothetical protein [Bacteroides sp.]
MRDGYYLSVYLHIDEIAHLYRFHIRHDQNVSLWKKEGSNIKLIHYWELERMTGLKRHCFSFFNREQAEGFLNGLLSRYHLKLEDMEAVFGTPQLDTIHDYHSIVENPTQSYHSIAHLFSALLSDTEKFYTESILAFAVDGGPDTVTDMRVNKKNYYTGCFSDKGNITTFEAISPGFIWTYARKKLNMREGTLMALATASASELLDEEPAPIVRIRRISDLEASNRYVSDLWDKINRLTDKDKGLLFNGFDEHFSEKENKISMLVKEIQKMSLRIMDDNIQNAIRLYDIHTEDCYIALAGGYILNCPTNSYIMNQYQFKGFLAPPCVNDAGLSMGMALYFFYKNMEKVCFKLEDAFYGDDCSDMEAVTEKYGHYIQSCSDMNINQFTEDLEAAPLVWFHGRAEIGPRALGHRSILADCRNSAFKDALNDVKKRQWWRPVAPIVLDDRKEEWFEDAYSSPYMLHTMHVKHDKVKQVPAICHIDKTARVQTVKQGEMPELYGLINAFYEKTGVPMICNTSLNDAGEPIINTMEECMNFALRKRFQVVYMNGKRIQLKNHGDYQVNTPLPRGTGKFFFGETEIDRLKKKYNPFELPMEVLIFKYLNPEIAKGLDITNSEMADKLKKYAHISRQLLGKIPIPGIEKRQL